MSVVEQEPVGVPAEVDVPTVSEEEARRREILLKAAEIMEQRGYAAGGKGITVDYSGRCVLGAVAEAMNSEIIGGTVVGAFYHYDPPSVLLGVPEYCVAYRWSDSLRAMSAPEATRRVAGVLRRMANGASWEDATGS